MSPSAKTADKSATKRLLQELRNNDDEPNPALQQLGPRRDDDLLEWRAVLKGVRGTAYEGCYLGRLIPYLNQTFNETKELKAQLRLTKLTGGLWELAISVPPNYPLAPPKITFVTPICHPNVHFKTGEICLDLLKTSWSPAYTISTTLTSVQQLLTSAEPDSPLNVDVAQLFRQGDLIGAEGLIRLYTRMWRWSPRQ